MHFSQHTKYCWKVLLKEGHSVSRQISSFVVVDIVASIPIVAPVWKKHNLQNFPHLFKATMSPQLGRRLPTRLDSRAETLQNFLVQNYFAKKCFLFLKCWKKVMDHFFLFLSKVYCCWLLEPRIDNSVCSLNWPASIFPFEEEKRKSCWIASAQRHLCIRSLTVFKISLFVFWVHLPHINERQRIPHSNQNWTISYKWTLTESAWCKTHNLFWHTSLLSSIGISQIDHSNLNW